MSRFASRCSAEASGLTDRIRREVVVQHKAPLYFTLLDVVHVLLVHLGAERGGDDRLRLAACEKRGSMNAWQPADLARDRTDLLELASVRATAFTEHVFAEDLFLQVRKCLTRHMAILRCIFGVALNDFFL